MRKGLLLSSGGWLLVASQLFAQSADTSANVKTLPAAQFLTPTASSSVLGDPVVPLPCQPACQTDCYRIWASAEFLLWWVKNAPMPQPLVTTGDPNLNPAGLGPRLAGAIGQPGTQVLFGQSSVNYGTLPGMRYGLGAWLDPERLFGVEGDVFYLTQRSNTFAISSNGINGPPLYLPAFAVDQGGERGLPIADPILGFAGNVAITSTMQFWGAEVNGLATLWRRPGQEVVLLAGFRYVDLSESLQLQAQIADTVFQNVTVGNDHFDTRNQFYGGQLGLRSTWQWDRFSVGLTAKVALGATHQSVNTQGDIMQTALPGGFAFTPGSFPGGFYSQQTNIGQRSANQFGVIPQIALKASYQFTPRLSGFIGYDFLYWNQVVRPGNQIDHNINQTQNAVLGGGALVGAAAPMPMFNRSDFWAQGVTFGVNFRY